MFLRKIGGSTHHATICQFFKKTCPRCCGMFYATVTTRHITAAKISLDSNQWVQKQRLNRARGRKLVCQSADFSCFSGFSNWGWGHDSNAVSQPPNNSKSWQKAATVDYETWYQTSTESMVENRRSDKAPTNKICRRAPLAWLWPKAPTNEILSRMREFSFEV